MALEVQAETNNCDTCIHKDVCMYALDKERLMKSVENAMKEDTSSNCKDIFHIDVVCKKYKALPAAPTLSRSIAKSNSIVYDTPDGTVALYNNNPSFGGVAECVIDDKKLDYYIIGSLNNCEQEIKDVADQYAKEGYSVEYVKLQPDISFAEIVDKCFNTIKRSKHVIAITNPSSPNLGKGTTYELAFAKQLGVPYTILHKE